MKHLILFAIGIVGLVAAVPALHGGPKQAEARGEYFASGQIQSECPTHEGVRDGECKRYWPNGKLQAQGQYLDGSMNGSWSFWNEDGTPDTARTGNYADGKFAAN